MTGDIWRDLRDLAVTRQWSEIIELTDPWDTNTVLVLTADEGLDALVTWCRAAAHTVPVRSATFAAARAAPASIWSAGKLVVALPVPVPEDAGPRLLADVRRWCTERPPDSYAVVSVPVAGETETAEAVRRSRRAIRRMLADGEDEPVDQHLTWTAVGDSSDAEELAGFLLAPVPPALKGYRRRRLLEAIEARLAAPAPGADEAGPVDVVTWNGIPTWLRSVETELLLGVDRLEQRLQRDLGVGRLAPADAAHELTIGFRDWRSAGRDAIRERWATLAGTPGEPPGLPELAPATAWPVAPPKASAGPLAGAMGVGTVTGVLARIAGTPPELAVLTGFAVGGGWRALDRQKARRTDKVAELTAARQLVADSGTAARARVRRFVDTELRPRAEELATVPAADRQPADRDTLRAARDALSTEPSQREATRA